MSAKETERTASEKLQSFIRFQRNHFVEETSVDSVKADDASKNSKAFRSQCKHTAP